jgi:membrane-associated phospholipid phosphatase
MTSKPYLWVGLSLLLFSAPLRAEVEPPAPPPRAAVDASVPPLRLSLPWDGATVALATAAVSLGPLLPVDTSTRWDTQLLPIDDHLKGRYSASAAKASDVLLAVDVAMPAALFTGQGFGRETGKRFVIYAETILASLALDSLAKPLLSRPRPYVYSDDPVLVAHAAGEGKDSHQSFYSRHASTAFAASVSGAYLFAQSTTDSNARAAVWGTELALASATADLRTRAGMHFYSDVLVGALVGGGLGLLVPYLHGGPRVRLGKREWLAIVLGPLVGIAFGELLPVGG